MRTLLSPFHKNRLSLKNHVVMAPMTRSRALGNLPNQLMAEYYQQRSGAGLIITEGTAPLPGALGYPNIPGIFSQAQIDGWRTVTNAVHQGGSKIYVQLMHTGRIGHTDNLPQGAKLSGVSDIVAAGQIFTSGGPKNHSQPATLTKEGIKEVIAGFVSAAKNAMEAGFDGVELHGANGYLIEQFFNPHINNRTDEYGGTVENRARFAIELTQAVAKAIGAEKAGIRLSPFSTVGDLANYNETDTENTYAYLAQQLNDLGITYLHLGVNAPIPDSTFKKIRANFDNIIILSNGLTAETGEVALLGNFADLVAFGRAFLANPDLITRIEQNRELNEVDYTTLYTPGAKGYTDYPVLEREPVLAKQ